MTIINPSSSLNDDDDDDLNIMTDEIPLGSPQQPQPQSLPLPLPSVSDDEPASALPSSSSSAMANSTTYNFSDNNDNDNDDDDNDDDEVNALLDDLESHQLPTEQEIALSKLKQSTSKLQSAILNISTDIDSKLKIQEKAKNIDSNFGLSQKASSTFSTVHSILDKLQIKQTAMDVANSETVRNVQYNVSDTLEHMGVNAVLKDGTQKLKNFDEEHRFSTMTVDALSGGMDWVAKSLNHVVGGSGSGSTTYDNNDNK